ncbi:MAG: hypothetical protein MK193_10015 [Lentisphaeria bacterium]|nr:hypothetical protein [Lentisphaeria bacterium]
MKKLIIYILIFTFVVAAEEEKRKTIRIQPKISMDTEVIELKKDDIIVTLYGAVHVGEAKYFKKLNESFKQHDVLLFELVGNPELVRKKTTKKGTSLISASQEKICDLLELKYQLDLIDYSAENFIHADFTDAELKAVLKQRGESLMGNLVDMTLTDMMSGRESVLNEWLLMATALNPNRVTIWRRLMAKEMIEGNMDTPTQNTIIHIRNEKALNVMKHQINKGIKDIAIFYGAAHLPDMVEQLEKMGFDVTKSEWIEAWILKVKKK